MNLVPKLYDLKSKYAFITCIKAIWSELKKQCVVYVGLNNGEVHVWSANTVVEKYTVDGPLMISTISLIRCKKIHIVSVTCKGSNYINFFVSKITNNKRYSKD